jgi:hypothetical protein
LRDVCDDDARNNGAAPDLGEVHSREKGGGVNGSDAKGEKTGGREGATVDVLGVAFGEDKEEDEAGYTDDESESFLAFILGKRGY